MASLYDHRDLSRRLVAGIRPHKKQADICIQRVYIRQSEGLIPTMS